MDKYSVYVLSTLGYGIVGFIGLIAAVYFIANSRYFLGLLGALVFIVAFDNFFCSCRARDAGLKTGKKHYVQPFPIRKKK